MVRNFRVTYIRTIYSEINVLAEDCREAEGQFEAAAVASPETLEQGPALFKPQYRIVDVVAADREEPAATSRAPRSVAFSSLVKPAA